MSQPFVLANSLATVVFAMTLGGLILLEWLVTYRERSKTHVLRDASLVSRTRVAAETLFEVSVTTTRGEKSEDRGTKWLVVGSLTVAFVLAVFAAKNFGGLTLPGNGWTWVVLGAALAWCGITLRVWAIDTLGRFFRRDVTVEADQTVVTAGPYRFLRHPAYAGNTLVAAGTGLMLANLGSLALLIVIPLLGLIPRIRVEEAALERELGEPYRRFAETRARLLPGVW